MSELNLKNNQNKINIYKFLWKTIKTRKFTLILLLLFMIINDTVGIFVTQYFNKLLINGATNTNISFNLGIFYLIMYACFQSIPFITSSIIYKFTFNSITKIQNNLRNNIYSYVIQHSMNYFNNSFSGALSNKIISIVNDTGKITTSMLDFISIIIITIIVPILYSKINIYIGLSFIIISIFYVLSLTKLRILRKQRMMLITENRNKFFGLINDNFANIRNIKMFSREKKENKNVKILNIEFMRNAYSFLKVVLISSIVNFIFSFVFIFSILGISAYMLAQNKINIGDFMFIITSIFKFIINSFTKKTSKFAEMIGKLENNLNSIARPIEIQNKKIVKILT